MAEQSGEQQPLLNSNDEVESDHERPAHVSENEENDITSLHDAGLTETTPAILEDVEAVTVPPPPVTYVIPDESPPPYTPPTKSYNFPTEPPGYVTPPEGWKIEGPPMYQEDGRVTLGNQRNVVTPFGVVSEDVLSAICIMLFCCFPLGLLALVCEYQALKYHRQGDQEKYLQRKRFAKKMLFIGLTLGFVINCILILSFSK